MGLVVNNTGNYGKLKRKRIKIAAVDLYSEDEYRSTAATVNGRFLEHSGSKVNTLREVCVLAGIPDSVRVQMISPKIVDNSRK